MKKLVKVLTFALCLPFAAVSFSSCSEDENEETSNTNTNTNTNQGDDQGNQDAQPLTGTLFTLDGNAVSQSSVLEFKAIPNPGLLAIGTTEIKACTTPLEGTSNHLKVTNATDSEKAIKVTVTLLQEKPASILNISWCGLEQGCAMINSTQPVTRQTKLAANSSANLELDAIFTENIYESCSFKVELEVDGELTETITVKFVYTA